MIVLNTGLSVINRRPITMAKKSTKWHKTEKQEITDRSSEWATTMKLTPIYTQCMPHLFTKRFRFGMFPKNKYRARGKVMKNNNPTKELQILENYNWKYLNHQSTLAMTGLLLWQLIIWQHVNKDLSEIILKIYIQNQAL